MLRREVVDPVAIICTGSYLPFSFLSCPWLSLDLHQLYNCHWYGETMGRSHILLEGKLKTFYSIRVAACYNVVGNRIGQ